MTGFRDGVTRLKRGVLADVGEKKMNGTVLDGPMLLGLTDAYVKAINEGALPTISTAWQASTARCRLQARWRWLSDAANAIPVTRRVRPRSRGRRSSALTTARPQNVVVIECERALKAGTALYREGAAAAANRDPPPSPEDWAQLHTDLRTKVGPVAFQPPPFPPPFPPALPLPPRTSFTPL